MSLSVPRVYAERYEIVRPLGEGAFSRTFVARDNVLQRDIALKVLRREHQANNEFSARFDREAQAAARVSHPNVVPVFDSGREQGLPFIVMQFIDGRTLRQFDRDEGPLTIEEVINIGRQVLDGLAAIHDQGIVHRDIKPQNVLLDQRMVARLTDFGVAFLTNDITLTESGVTIGTAAYMAPEQATGRAIGPTADIYSVGVMLYELLTQRLPFRGDNPVQVLYRHVSDLPPRPRDLNPRIPVELESILLRSLAKIPSERFPDARTMRDSLGTRPSVVAPLPAQTTIRAIPERFPEPTPAPPPSTPTRRTPTPARKRASRRRWPWILSVVVAIALLTTAIVAFAMNGLGDAGNDNPVAAQATATEAQVPGGALSEPTSTETPEATAIGATQPTALPTPAEPANGATPTASQSDPGGAPPGVEFNAPFIVSVLPPAWNQGSRVAFNRDDFVEGGAYRRDDGVLYDRPAAHLYSQATEYPAASVVFTAMEAAGEYIGVVILGMDDEFPAHVPCRILLNGNLVWEGEAPFGNEEWTLIGWRLGNLTWLQEGDNTLTFEVLASDGEFGRPPWILLTEAAIYWD